MAKKQSLFKIIVQKIITLYDLNNAKLISENFKGHIPKRTNLSDFYS